MTRAAFVLALLFARCASGAEYWVDPVRGDDAASGAWDRPWKTLGHASMTVSRGDTVHAGAGTYSPASGEPTELAVNGWHLLGEGPALTVIEDVALMISSLDTAIDGVTLLARTTGGVHQVWQTFGSGITPGPLIRNCVVSNASFISYYFGGPFESSPTFLDNLFIDSGGPAYRLRYQFQGQNQQPGAIIRVVMSNNVVIRGQGLLRYEAASACNFDPWDARIELTGNTVVASTGDAIYLDHQVCGPINGLVISNNIITDSVRYGIAEQIPYLPLNADEIANNLFSGNALGAYLDEGVTTMSTAADVNTLPNATGNLDGTPLVVNPASDDYRLAAGSPGIDAALASRAAPTDFEGDQRPIDGDGDTIAIPDIGADEFNPSAALLRNVDVTQLDPLTPQRAVVLPLRPPRDDYLGLLPAFALDDPGVLSNPALRLVFYQLTRPNRRLYLSKAVELRLNY